MSAKVFKMKQRHKISGIGNFGKPWNLYFRKGLNEENRFLLSVKMR